MVQRWHPASYVVIHHVIAQSVHTLYDQMHKALKINKTPASTFRNRIRFQWTFGHSPTGNNCMWIVTDRHYPFPFIPTSKSTQYTYLQIYTSMFELNTFWQNVDLLFTFRALIRNITTPIMTSRLILWIYILFDTFCIVMTQQKSITRTRMGFS